MARATETASDLEAGFARQSIQRAAGAFESALERPQHSAALLLLSTICRRIADSWEGPVTATDAQAIRTLFLPLIRALATSVSANDNDAVRVASNALATAYLDTRLI